jgi:hypothetical protein
MARQILDDRNNQNFNARQNRKQFRHVWQGANENVIGSIQRG